MSVRHWLKTDSRNKQPRQVLAAHRAICKQKVVLINLWSVQHSASHIDLVTITSQMPCFWIIASSFKWYCLYLEYYNVLYLFTCLNRVLLLLTLGCSQHKDSKEENYCFSFCQPPSPSVTPFQFSLSVPSPALKFPKWIHTLVTDIALINLSTPSRPRRMGV